MTYRPIGKTIKIINDADNAGDLTISAIVDDDKDTYITTEKTVDEDVIRMFIADSEKITLNSTTLTLNATVVLGNEPTADNHAVTKLYADSLSTGSVDKTIITTGTADTIGNVDIVVVNKSTAGSHTLTLPAGSTFTKSILIIKDGKGDAATNNITINTSNSETIDGASSKLIDGNYNSMSFIWNGTEWNIV